MSYFYVNMKYKIDYKKELFNLVDVEFLGINSVSKETLFEIFEKCFTNGDAEFYKNLKNTEKREFFENELGFPKVLEQPESHLVKFNGKIVGYTLAMQYGKKNIQISCMCVLPEFQNKGIGQAMLSQVELIARNRKNISLTLGTEDTMKAYQLYLKYGFKETKRFQM